MTESKDQKKVDLETEFPGIPLAYPIAMESYKMARERFDLMEKRGQSLIVFVTSVGLAVLTLASKKTTTPPISTSLVIATLSYLVSVIFAFASQMYGKLIGPDPRLLREKALVWDEWTFQNNLIYWAGEHYGANLEIIKGRAQMVTGTLTFGLITLLSLAVWVS